MYGVYFNLEAEVRVLVLVAGWGLGLETGLGLGLGLEGSVNLILKPINSSHIIRSFVRLFALAYA